MNKTFKSALFLLLLVTTGFISRAQEDGPPRQAATPRWVSAKGYWVIQSNTHQPTRACVYFYNNDNVLVHREIVEGIRLQANNYRTKMKLKKALETVIDRQVAGNAMDNSGQVVAGLFKH